MKKALPRASLAEYIQNAGGSKAETVVGLVKSSRRCLTEDYYRFSEELTCAQNSPAGSVRIATSVKVIDAEMT